MTLREYVESLSPVAVHSGEVFAKILAENDDAGRHGLLVPSSVYPFFPEMTIADPAVNQTMPFAGFNSIDRRLVELAYKYYQRYPERRVTRLPGMLNDRTRGPRMIVFARIVSDSGDVSYLVDAAVQGDGPRFERLAAILFSQGAAVPGSFVVRPLDVRLVLDDALTSLLQKFDRVRGLGWTDSLRSGPTGVGYTFETLLGIKENNAQTADYLGIEIKCKVRNEKGAPGKVNLFQLAPEWTTPGTALDRLRAIGELDKRGRLACYSQLTTRPNSKGLWIAPMGGPLPEVRLQQGSDLLGRWSVERLSQRLDEKHARAVFISAGKRQMDGSTQYRYEELIYCERPDINRFIAMVRGNRLVFEFAMREGSGTSVRNHGYPWRLVDTRELDQLFALQQQLR